MIGSIVGIVEGVAVATEGGGGGGDGGERKRGFVKDLSTVLCFVSLFPAFCHRRAHAFCDVVPAYQRRRYPY